MCSLVLCQCQVMHKNAQTQPSNPSASLPTYLLGTTVDFFLLSWSSVKIDFFFLNKANKQNACHQMINVQLVADCSKDCILLKCDPSFGLHGDC